MASPNTAAATARQKSTSRPVQLPLSSGNEKPGVPVPTPQLIMPRPLTVVSVGLGAGGAGRDGQGRRGREGHLEDWFHLVRSPLLR